MKKSFKQLFSDKTFVCLFIVLMVGLLAGIATIIFLPLHERAKQEKIVGCVPGEVKQCLIPLEGICRYGEIKCQPDRTWGVCMALVAQGDQKEDCRNGLDDDCDGDIDCDDVYCNYDWGWCGGR